MVYLSPEAQHIRETALHVLFCISMFLNLVSLYCLIKQTPPNQAKIRNFLLFMQVMVISIGIYSDILLEPLPLFPATAGICTGVLCTIGVHPPSAMGGLILLYIWLAAALGFCILFRHQTLLSDQGKLGKWKSGVVIFLALFIPLVPAGTYAFWKFDASIVDPMMIASPYNISWAIERGPHFMLERTQFLILLIWALVTLTPSALVLFLIFFFHMFYVLYRDNSQSKSRITKIRKSLLVLLIQLLVPFVFVAAPFTIMFAGLIYECLSFEVTLCLFGITSLHPIVHNLILLLITPTYRSIIMSLPRKLRAARGVEPLTSVSNVQSMQLRQTQRRATSQ